MNDKIEIPLSKKKILLALAGSIMFVVFGYLGAVDPEKFISRMFRSPEVIRISGIAAICFFGLCLVFIVRKLLDNKIGLTIDQYGITDNTNATSAGLIEWQDITGITKVQVASTKILLILTDKPDKYIERATNIISKQAMKANYKLYGSPISIISHSLKMSFDDLEKMITTEFHKRKS